ncbi:MAG: pilus assembly protein PilZ [Treponema sp.]|nr:pilus assembly protein PilZ [Treponema sp.]
MGVITSQQLTRYYEQFCDTEIAFSKDIIRVLNIDPRQIYIKCNGTQWPCIINSTSFKLARIIIGTKGGAYQMISQKEPPAVSLRFCFKEEGNQMMSFFVNSKVTNISPYMNSQDLVIVTLTFTQRPPDDLIEQIGGLLEANQNAIRRKEEYILINEENKRKLGLMREETVVMIENVPRHCILRQISFGGAKFILLGLSQFLTNKEAVIQMDFEEPQERIQIKGKIVAAGIVEGRKDIVAVNMQFDEKLVSLTYKMHINGFLQQQRKIKVSAADQLAQQRAKMQSAKKPEDEAKDGKTAEAKTEEAKAESQTEEAAENQTEENPASEAAPAETSPASEAKAAGDAEPAPEAAE